MRSPSAAPEFGPANQLIPLQIEAVRILLVTETVEGSERLRETIEASDREIACVVANPDAIEPLKTALETNYDVVIVEASPANLNWLLETVRERQIGARVLVVFHEPETCCHASLAGVLPRNRAMGCNRGEIKRLLGNHSDNRPVAPIAPRIL
jgi:hypothetical protein